MLYNLKEKSILNINSVYENDKKIGVCRFLLKKIELFYLKNVQK